MFSLLRLVLAAVLKGNIRLLRATSWRVSFSGIPNSWEVFTNRAIRLNCLVKCCEWERSNTLDQSCEMRVFITYTLPGTTITLLMTGCCYKIIHVTFVYQWVQYRPCKYSAWFTKKTIQNLFYINNDNIIIIIMTYLWGYNNIKKCFSALSKDKIYRHKILQKQKINYTLKAVLNKYVFSWALNWATVGELRICMGTSFEKNWGSDNKGPFTVGLNTGANRDHVAHRTHVICSQVTGRNIQSDAIFQMDETTPLKALYVRRRILNWILWSTGSL